jgi:hypothetical protein
VVCSWRGWVVGWVVAAATAPLPIPLTSAAIARAGKTDVLFVMGFVRLSVSMLMQPRAVFPVPDCDNSSLCVTEWRSLETFR